MTRREAVQTLAAGAVGPGLDLRYRTYTIRSASQLYDNSLRVLEPSAKGAARRVLYVLPVNPDVSYRWGDGFETAARLRLHEKHGMVMVAPAFSAWPWYADHPVNVKVRQESYFLGDVVPFVDGLFPGHKRLLVGFSKSGNGAMQLLLRKPELFAAAAVWDAPLMKEAPDQFGMGEIYGTAANFAEYCVPRLLEKRAGEWGGKKARVALLGYDAFREHMEKAHALMERLGMAHRYENTVRRVHRWDSGWLEGAVGMLDEMTR
jgi:hypothetical protein